MTRKELESVEERVATEVLGWEFKSVADGVAAAGYYKDGQYMGWPAKWARDMAAAWELAGSFTKQAYIWDLSTMKEGRYGSFVELRYLASPIQSYHEVIRIDKPGQTAMPLAICEALLEMANLRSVAHADGTEEVR